MTTTQESTPINEYRCTRPDLYPEGTPGHTDPCSRQGHYIRATSAGAAIDKMREKHPSEAIEVQLWKRDVK